MISFISHYSDWLFRNVPQITESDPWFPAGPNSAKHVWIHGLVQQTVHLLLHRQACSRKPRTDVVLLSAQSHRLHPWEGSVLLKAQLQLLTDKINQTSNHTQAGFRVQMLSFVTPVTVFWIRKILFNYSFETKNVQHHAFHQLSY